MAKLAQVLQMPEVALRLDRLHFETMNGFMNGLIDLTFEHEGRFYFADWKSNHLGPTRVLIIRRRSRPRCSAISIRSSSVSTAWRCIATCGCAKPGYDFDRHFGGAFYIFLRGIDLADPKNGVYFQRLSRSFVEELSGIFDS